MAIDANEIIKAPPGLLAIQVREALRRLDVTLPAEVDHDRLRQTIADVLAEANVEVRYVRLGSPIGRDLERMTG